MCSLKGQVIKKDGKVVTTFTQEQALEYVSNNLTNIPKDAKNKSKIYDYVNYLFTNEYIPHVGKSFINKGLYTGYLILAIIISVYPFITYLELRFTGNLKGYN